MRARGCARCGEWTDDTPENPCDCLLTPAEFRSACLRNRVCDDIEELVAHNDAMRAVNGALCAEIEKLRAAARAFIVKHDRLEFAREELNALKALVDPEKWKP